MLKRRCPICPSGPHNRVLRRRPFAPGMPMTTAIATPDADLADPILALEQAGREAFLARDIGRLAGLWSDALQVNSPINRVHSKQQVLGLLQAGVIAHTALDATI